MKTKKILFAFTQSNPDVQNGVWFNGNIRLEILCPLANLTN